MGRWRNECFCFSVRYQAHVAQGMLLDETSLGLERSNMAPSAPVLHLLLTCWFLKAPELQLQLGVSRKGDSSKLLNPFLFISTTAQSLHLGRRVGRGSDQRDHLQVLKVVLCALHFGLCTCYSLNPECPQPSSSAPLAILYIFQEPTQISTPLGSLSLFLRSTDNILLCASNIAWSFSRHKHLRDR